MKKLLCIVAFVSVVFAADGSVCDEKVFSNLSANKGTSISQVIDQLSAYCNFSVIVKDDEAEKQLDRTLNVVNLKNFTLPDLLNFILTENNFIHEYKNGILKISYLTTKTFKVDYLRTIRQGTGNTDVSVSGSSSGSSSSGSTTSPVSSGSGSTAGSVGGGSSSGASNAGKTNITTNDAAFDFWLSVTENVRSILATNSSEGNSTAQNLNNIVINKEAGLITVTASKEKLNRIDKFLETLMERLHRQVLIDVKILSVNLDQSKKTGIDWSKLDLSLKHNSNYTQTGIGSAVKDVLFGNSLTILNSATFSMDGLISFLGSYGDVKSLSNPKILALNNQPALISSGDRYYYKTTGTVVSGGTASTTTANDTVSDVFAGVMLDITPEILDDDTILIKINPAITTPRDSSVASQNSNSSNQVATRNAPPDMRVKQTSSVAKAKDGEKIILGGLISDDIDTKTTKVPLLGDLPIFGRLFKSDGDNKSFSELVIIITPHIIKKEKALSLRELGFNKINNE